VWSVERFALDSKNECRPQTGTIPNPGCLASSYPRDDAYLRTNSVDLPPKYNAHDFTRGFTFEQERGCTLPKYRLKWLIATSTINRATINLDGIFVPFPNFSLDQRGVNRIIRQIDDVRLASGEIDQFFAVPDARQACRADTRVCEAINFGSSRGCRPDS
jgi:hypothetical protein